MNKITIKHFINKHIKPIENNGKYFYAVYTLITAYRKTTQIKSLTNLYMTDNGFALYEMRNSLVEEEYIQNKSLIKSLHAEKIFIENSIRFIEEITCCKYDISKGLLRSDLQKLQTPARSILIKSTKFDIVQGRDTFDDLLLRLIKDEEPLFKVCNIFKSALNIDITRHINQNFLTQWNLIDNISEITDTCKSYLNWCIEEVPHLRSRSDFNLIESIVSRANNICFKANYSKI